MRVFSIVRQQRRTFWLGSVIGAAGAIGSALLGSKASKYAADAASERVLSLDEQKDLFNYQQARLEAQQNSAHQREIADLRAAGLNPILSANGGQGAASGIASPIDVGAYNSARASINAQRVQARLQMADGLLQAGNALMRNFIDKENANSAAMKAEADLQNSITNANNSASQIALNAENAKYMSASAKKVLDDMLTNTFLRQNLASQSLLNRTSASSIAAKTPSEIELNKASAESTPFKFGVHILNKVSELLGDDVQKNVNSAKEESNKPRKQWSLWDYVFK